MLDLLPGRKLDELRTYSQGHPGFLLLNPKAVVMDLAQAYHTWIRECFPKAIRIADRFHVHGYVIESVQEVRKTVQNTLSPRAKAYLKANRLNTLLHYSPLLRSVWEWKEAFTVWYNCSPNYAVAKTGFERWCEVAIIALKLFSVVITLLEIAIAIRQAFSSNATVIGCLANCQALIMIKQKVLYF